MNKTLHKLYIGAFLFVGIASTVILAINGYHYYSTPLEERFFLAQHHMLRPSGLIGHGLGIIGSLMMIVGVAVYMLRKRVRKFFHFGYLKNWLELHIFLCTLGPIFVLFHTAFKFGGIVAVSFWSMTAVVLSGVIGRFLYVQIPHTIQGQVIGLNELNDMNQQLTDKLVNDFAINEKIISQLEKYTTFVKYKRIKLGKSIGFLIKDYFGIKSVLSNLKAELKTLHITKSERKEIIKTAKAKLVISRRIGLLQTMQKLFKYWHIVHLPFALTMFIIMIIHIAVTIAFGYKWIF